MRAHQRRTADKPRHVLSLTLGTAQQLPPQSRVGVTVSIFYASLNQTHVRPKAWARSLEARIAGGLRSKPIRVIRRSLRRCGQSDASPHNHGRGNSSGRELPLQSHHFVRLIADEGRVNALVPSGPRVGCAPGLTPGTVQQPRGTELHHQDFVLVPVSVTLTAVNQAHKRPKPRHSSG